MEKWIIHSDLTSDSELFVGENLMGQYPLIDLCQKLKGHVVICSDVALKNLYAKKLSETLNADLIFIPSGEKSKSFETANKVLGQLFKLQCRRDTVLIALGGGVTTDLVGFVASIFMRGIPFISIPTTLLAMVDASIGGKTGIDISYGKNLIGSFYPPHAIICDFKTLESLPENEYLNGVAEIIKMGLIQDASICELFMQGLQKNELIYKAIQGKIKIVEQDPKEKGLRRILNFGHTIGHGLESISDYQMAHGEAVALGCIVESYLSMILGFLSQNDFELIQKLFRRFSLHLPKNFRRDSILKAMSFDKKNINNALRFVLIDRIGHAIPFQGDYCRSTSEVELLKALQWMEDQYG